MRTGSGLTMRLLTTWIEGMALIERKALLQLLDQ